MSIGNRNGYFTIGRCFSLGIEDPLGRDPVTTLPIVKEVGRNCFPPKTVVVLETLIP
jgi:hypothetical protein